MEASIIQKRVDFICCRDRTERRFTSTGREKGVRGCPLKSTTVFADRILAILELRIRTTDSD